MGQKLRSMTHQKNGRIVQVFLDHTIIVKPVNGAKDILRSLFNTLELQKKYLSEY